MFETKKMTRKALLGAAAVATAMSFAGPSNVALAEDYSTGTMTGAVRDEAGSALSGATVTIKSVDRGFERSSVTDANGRVKFPLLPLGDYTVNVSKAGYSLPEQTVSINTGNPVYTFTMDSAGSVDEIFVTGTSQGQYDFNATTTGLSVNVDDLFDKTPIGRNATSVALLAPGTALGDSAFASGTYVNSGAVASIGGNSVAENAYYVNGLNVTNFRNFIGGSTIPFAFYDQIQVKTGGYPAEFGRSTGGTINAVTKSGGNEFHFGVNMHWTPDGLRSDSPNTFTQLNDRDERDNFETDIWASGPIIEDKLFFFAILNTRDYRSYSESTSFKNEFSQQDPFWGVKVDFNITDDHLLEFTRFVDDQTATTRRWRQSDGSYVGDTINRDGGENTIVKYTGTFTDWLAVSVLWGENIYKRDDTASNASTTPYCYDVTNTVACSDYVNQALTLGTDKRELTRADVDVYATFMGDHHFRFGIDQETQTANTNEFYTGGGRYQYYGAGGPGTGSARRYIRTLNGGFETELSAWYIQDAWEVSFVDNLTLNLGIRNETFDNKNVNGDTFAKLEDQVAARVGFSWDPTGDGMTQVFGSYGRYYLGIAANTNMRLGGNERYTREIFSAGEYVFNPDGSLTATCPGDFDVVHPAGFSYASCASLTVYGDGTIFDARELVSKKLDPMYQDEFILGFNHSFGNGWHAGVQATYRDLGSLIEDAAIDDAVIQWALDNGYGDVSGIFSGFHQYTLINPGNDVQVYSSAIGGGVWMDLSAQDMGYPKGRRTYKAIDITFEREFDGVWSLQGSYTLSESKGNYEGTVKSDIGQDDAGLTQDFDKPGLMDGAYGLLPNHHRHKLKMWGSYALNDMVSLGGNLSITSPRKYSCLGYHGAGPANGAYWYGAASWYCNGQLNPRGSRMESDWITTFDMSVQVTPSIPGLAGDVKFRADIFNVFDQAGARELWNNGENSTIGDLDADYGKPVTYQAPRSVRFSVMWQF